MEEIHWYYIDPDSKTQIGPVSLQEMQTLYGSGRLSEDTFAWHEEAEEWARLKDLKYRDKTIRDIGAISALGNSEETHIVDTLPDTPLPQVSSDSRPRKDLSANRYSSADTEPETFAPAQSNKGQKSLFQELQQRVERIQQVSNTQNIEERIKVNRTRGETTSGRLPSTSVVVPPKRRKSVPIQPESSSSSSDTVRHTQDSDSESDDEAAWDWVERTGPDGNAFFLNLRTGENTQNRPEVLEELVWLPDTEAGYRPVRLLPGSNQEIRAQGLDSDTLVPVPLEVVPTLQKFRRGQLTATHSVHSRQDLVRLHPLHESGVLSVLKNRLSVGKVYTRIGNVMVVLNPYTPLPLYSQSLITQLRSGETQADPHIYEIAFSALNAMRENRKNQSILITGESGSGKTEAAKHCIRFLAEAAGSDQGAEERLLMATPILESFGNAKTIRNENSSRVGKWTEVHFSQAGMIIGAQIRNFLLEKTRVVHQAKGERNFRIFYQLLAHQSEFPELNLSSAPHWTYMNEAAVRQDTEAQSFQDVRAAMRSFVRMDQEGVFRVVAAILHLGNMTFTDRESNCDIVSDVHFNSACALLQVPPDRLRQALCRKTLTLAKETIFKSYTLTQATETCANLCKVLYVSLFQWIIDTINAEARTSIPSESSIGILDIYGFEIFPENSFEQLCINYANEKLQQYFVQCLFKEEEDVYESEGVAFHSVPFHDNLPILDLIESGGNSLLWIINDEITLQRASDDALLKRIYTAFQANPAFFSEFRSNSQFLVQHYSGEVIYEATGFIAKSKDQVSDDLIGLIGTSESEFLGQMCTGQLRQSKKSIGIQFKEELDGLLTSLTDYTAYFVRCIKPNGVCGALQFDGSLVLHQIRCLGLLEAAEILQMGFPFKMPHKEFVHRYKCINMNLRAPNPKAMCKKLIEACGEPETGFRIGKTMVLFGFRQRRSLEKQRNSNIKSVVILAQKSKRYLRLPQTESDASITRLEGCQT